MNTSRIAFPVAAIAMLACAACSHDRPAASYATTTSVDVTPQPLTAPAPPPAPASVAVSNDITDACKITIGNTDKAPKFGFDDSGLTQNDVDTLTQVATCLTSGPLKGKSVSLVGHADPRGDDDYNMALGQRRAQSVADFLLQNGVPNAQLTTSSRGKMDATGTDEAGWAFDRRVDVSLAP